MNQQNQQEKLANEWNEICKEEGEISTKKRKMEEEKENMATKKQKIMDEILKGMGEKDEEIGKLKKEIRALKMKMTKMETDLKAQNMSIFRKMPAELMNELFASLPLENAFDLLAKMPNGLLARNVQKMISIIKMAMKANKWNEKNCGPQLAISENGLNIIHSGPNEVNCVRSFLPIPSINLAINKSIISFYFEVKILQKNYGDDCFGFGIGFCTREFPLEGKYLGIGNNNSPYSIVICRKDGIYIDGNFIKLEGNDYNSFAQGDVIGFGIIYSPEIMQCFATWNGKLIGKTELSSKYAKIQLYPAIDMNIVGDSIGTNFGKGEWQFKQFNKLLQ